MTEQDGMKILFVVNPGSGSNKTDWPTIITEHFKKGPHIIELYNLPQDCNRETISKKIQSEQPHMVVAVGGDGTVKLVAECIVKTETLLGILPAGSANGLAKELGISSRPEEALDVLVSKAVKKIHVTMVNGHMCIHLSDVGFNAFVVKEFNSQKGRGMWGYLKASVKVLFKNPHLKAEMNINNTIIRREAAMIVIANATKYGSGALINPSGKLDDTVFEVVAIKKVSFGEIFKMVVSHAKHDKTKTETFQTNHLKMKLDKKRFFQVDGEFLGRVDTVEAVLIPDAISIVVPQKSEEGNPN